MRFQLCQPCLPKLAKIQLLKAYAKTSELSQLNLRESCPQAVSCTGCSGIRPNKAGHQKPSWGRDSVLITRAQATMTQGTLACSTSHILSTATDWFVIDIETRRDVAGNHPTAMEKSASLSMDTRPTRQADPGFLLAPLYRRRSSRVHRHCSRNRAHGPLSITPPSSLTKNECRRSCHFAIPSACNRFKAPLQAANIEISATGLASPGSRKTMSERMRVSCSTPVCYAD